MNILIQQENALASDNKREPNILNLKNKLYEPMKRWVVMNISSDFVKIHMEMAKHDINFSDNGSKVLVYSNHVKNGRFVQTLCCNYPLFLTGESFDQLSLLSVFLIVALVIPLSC